MKKLILSITLFIFTHISFAAEGPYFAPDAKDWDECYKKASNHQVPLCDDYFGTVAPNPDYYKEPEYILSLAAEELTQFPNMKNMYVTNKGDELTILDIIVNRGNCKVAKDIAGLKVLPKTLNFGEVLDIAYFRCTLLEAVVVTDIGNFEFSY